MKRKHKHR